MDGFAESGRIVLFRINHLVTRSLNVVDEDVAGASGAVVIEIVVAIFSVLWLVVFLNGADDAHFRVVVDVKRLLDNFPPLSSILLAEGTEGHDAHLIVG